MADDERIWLDGKINGKPVRLAFDTGAFSSVLFPKAVKRMGLKVNPRTSGVGTERVFAETTEECELSVWNSNRRVTFHTFELPAVLEKLGNVNIDGLYGWDQIGSNIFLIDAEALTVKFLERVPAESAQWTKLAISERYPTLALEIPGQLWTMAVDTGAPEGVALVSQKWREWKAAHTDAPLTMRARYSPNIGFNACEEAWAKELSLDAFVLTGVPIRQASPIESARGQPILGLAALKRLDFIVDGRQGVAYLRPRRTAPPPYNHNRLGAEFVPRHSQSDEEIAYVVSGSPAETAGIRNGDILLEVSLADAKDSRTDQGGQKEFANRYPAGTKLNYTVKRGAETLKFSVVLKDILSP